ncbi:DNA methyltransferase [Desulfosarcina widdelii]|uniref:site-specific DNA-methyltransferase (adenine-specific) n=2 Tax=Desulfosarcina widdelii TaxID=947919 RepID=A0A5K7ZES6_9BACT|nr:DNA methyltransferase [Desulfosarcina widdelii]
MINGEMKSKVDKLWEEFWTGGITNPLTVIEQISYLMFARLLDVIERRNEKRARRTNAPFKRIFAEDQQHLRWSSLVEMGAPQMLPLMRDEVFPHFKNVAMADTPFGEYMKDAQLLIQKPTLLATAVTMIDALPLDRGDVKGDLYEYLLGKLTTAGINGQFRTPRHIIRMMVELVDPCLETGEKVADPAMGTAGFLVGVVDYLLEKYSSADGILEQEGLGKAFTGDLMTPDQRMHLESAMFHGFDFDATMLRIAVMNLMLHGIDAPFVKYQDSLSNTFTDRFPDQAADAFDVVLANPPFKGSLDYEDVHPTLLAKIKTKKTELLFVALILRMLKLGGRSATIVPDGVLFGSSKAHVGLRKMLVEENQLEGIISLPSGVFKPYAGVSTAIIVFTKGGRTDQVFYYDVTADGFSLDDKRTKVEANDIPDVIKRWKARDPKKDTDRTGTCFFVPKEKIKANKYDLSINRYKEVVYEEEVYDPPKVILERMRALEEEILADMAELEGMLG